MLGTNPFAYAVPAGEEDPIFLDIASSAVAGGKVRIAQVLNQKVPGHLAGRRRGRAHDRPVRSIRQPARCCRSPATRATASR